MTRVQFIDDLPECFTDGDGPGVDIPEALAGLPLTRLRLVDDTIVDASTLRIFYLDRQGQRHAVPGPGRQKMKIGWDTPLAQADDGSWRATSAADLLAEVKATALAALVSEADRIAETLVAGYSDAERSAWPAKLEEAKAVVAGDLAPGDAVILPIEAALRGTTVAALAAQVVAKAPLTLAIPAAVGGLRAATASIIAAAGDEAAVAAALEAAKAKAEALAGAIRAGDIAAFRALLA